MPALPEPDRGVLKRPPLGLVLCQIQLGEGIEPSQRFGLELRTRLLTVFPEFTQLEAVTVQSSAIEFGPQGVSQVAAPPSRPGWQVLSTDGTWTVSCVPGALTVQRRSYVDWSDFKSRFEAALRATAEFLSPQIETRLGLRYFNALSHPEATSAQFWIGKVNPSFLGPLGDPLLGPAVATGVARIIFHFDDDLQSIVTLTTRPDAEQEGRVAFVFDIDVVRSKVQEFAVESILNVLDAFNTRALQIFQRVVTPEYFRELKGEPV